MSTHADPSNDEYLKVEKKLGAAELELAENLADADKTLDAGVEKRKKGSARLKAPTELVRAQSLSHR